MRSFLVFSILIRVATLAVTLFFATVACLPLSGNNSQADREWATEDGEGRRGCAQLFSQVDGVVAYAALWCAAGDEEDSVALGGGVGLIRLQI